MKNCNFGFSIKGKENTSVKSVSGKQVKETQRSMDLLASKSTKTLKENRGSFIQKRKPQDDSVSE